MTPSTILDGQTLIDTESSSRVEVLDVTHHDAVPSTSASAPAPAAKLPSAIRSSLPIRILTHNIRYAADPQAPGERPWEERCPRLCAELIFNSCNQPTSFLCLQEVLHPQLKDVMTTLQLSNPDWAYLGVGRDDGLLKGEFSPILYQKSVWFLLKWKTIWLSPTPTSPSKGWDAGSIRIVTIAHFMHTSTRITIVVMNTHFDNEGVRSRLESASIVLRLVEQVQHLPVFLAGDLNSTPDDDAYRVLSGPGSGLKDARTLVAKEKRYGHQVSFTGFEGKEDERELIDFVFCSARQGVYAKAYGILENRFDDGVYLSDHRAVVADLEIEKQA